jgi:hypothetical protein
MNQPDPNIDELLNSLIDEELTDTQRAEVERLIAYNSQVAQRLRQLQKTKMLISCLPRHKAPQEIIERVKASLAVDTTPAEQRSYVGGRKGMRQLLARRVLAAAAMIALIAVLGGVIYTILAPENVTEGPMATVARVEPVPSETYGVRFGGRLELKADALVAVNAFINRIIEDHDLSACVTITRQVNKRLYSLNCSRQDLNLLLADLQRIWQHFSSATLYIDTEQFNRPIVVNAVTAEQAAEVVGQDNPQRSIEIAKEFAVLNNMAELMPTRQILTAIDDKNVGLISQWPIPKPVLTGERKTTEKIVRPSEHKPETSLTIIVVGGE